MMWISSPFDTSLIFKIGIVLFFELQFQYREASVVSFYQKTEREIMSLSGAHAGLQPI